MKNIFTEKYIIEGVEIPNKEIYEKILSYFDKVSAPEKQWYRIRPTQTLIHVLINVFSHPEKEKILLEKIKDDQYITYTEYYLERMGYNEIKHNNTFYVEFSPEEIDLINKVGLFTVEQALASLNDKGLWNDSNSGTPRPSLGITEEDIIIEKQVKTLFNMKRGYRI